MVNQKNKQTFYPNPVGAVSNRTGAECLINPKVYQWYITEITVILIKNVYSQSNRKSRFYR